ncbi:MAG: hypothetical protein V4659_06910 [Pseudomonadota bacterium]
MIELQQCLNGHIVKLADDTNPPLTKAASKHLADQAINLCDKLAYPEASPEDRTRLLRSKEFAQYRHYAARQIMRSVNARSHAQD